MLGPYVLMTRRSASSSAMLSMRLHSALSGTFDGIRNVARDGMRARISLRMDSLEPCVAQETNLARLVLAQHVGQTMLRPLDVRTAIRGWLPYLATKI